VGGSGINVGGNGTTSASTASVGGSGGANTGGGGGGTFGNGATSGAGGSGIVVIAFPKNVAITTNAAAVLPSTLYNSGKYNDVLSNDLFYGTKTTTLTTSAYSSVKGAFSCKLVNYNYFGPTVTLRHALDPTGTSTQNFYTDVCGNMGTGYLGTGQSVSAWLTANMANITVSPNKNVGNTATTWISNGVTWTADSTYASSNYPAYIANRAFDGTLTETTSWSANGNSYGTASGTYFIYSGGTTYQTIISGGVGTINGEWMQISSNTPVSLSSFAFGSPHGTTDTYSGRIPGQFYIVGSNAWSGTAQSWTPIAYCVFTGNPYLSTSTNAYTYTYSIPTGTVTSQALTGNMTITTYGNSASTFTYYRFVATALLGTTGSVSYQANTGVMIGEWVLNCVTSPNPNTTYAFVSKWYDQGMDVSFNCATQYTTTAQPIYDVSYGLINYGYTGAGGGTIAPQTNCYFNLPNSTMPVGISSFTVTFKHGYNDINGGYVGAGTYGTANAVNAFRCNGGTGYKNYWWVASDWITGGFAVGNVVSYVYNTTASTGAMYINSSSYYSGGRSGLSCTAINNTIGVTNSSEYLNGQLYFMYIFNTPLTAGTTSDLVTIEATPATYAPPATMSASVYSVTSSTFALSTSTVAGANYFVVFVNGAATYTSGTGLTALSNVTVSPTMTGPWTINVYAYNASNVMLATGYTSATPLTLTISPTITNWSNTTDVSGTSITNGITYNVYAFKTTGVTYTITYSSNTSTYCYVLAVAGGGGGSSGGGGGGGGGGVVMTPVNVPSSSGTITVSVGAGGSGDTTANNTTGTQNGFNTTVTFNTTTAYATITATGGGYGSGTNGGSTPYVAGGTGGSGGGSNAVVASGSGNNNNLNYANSGGITANNCSGGGGGAGTASSYGNGGNGIQCFLPGISTFSPSGTSYVTYYWGGGGGGSASSASISAGNGGMGGGGGGNNNTSFTAGIGGGSSINIGGSGLINDIYPSTKVAGAGGANTGGGGGGAWNGFGGSGGSGIVVIAFPKSVVVTNAAAVLPSIVYSSGKYNDVLSNDSFGGNKITKVSTAAYSSVKGAFSCKLVNYDYFGPTVTLRHTLDTTGINTQNFYTDICGNMGTGYLGTGQSVSAWLQTAGANTTYAFVSKWYNQGMDTSFNCATQYTLASQPIYDVSYGVINFGYQGALGGAAAINTNAFFNLPDGAYPYLDSTYTYTLCHWNLTAPTTAFYSITNGGTSASSQTCSVGLDNLGKYCQNWYANDFNGTAGKYAFTGAKSTVTFKYITGAAANSRTNYVNYATTTYSESNTPSAIRAQTNINNYIGKSVWWANFNGQLDYLYVFNSALTTGITADQGIVEATPSTYTRLTTSINLTFSNATATTVSLTTSIVTGASYFVVYINGTVAYTSATGLTYLMNATIPIGSNANWTANVYAYNSSNVLLATGYGSEATSGIIQLSTNGITYKLYVCKTPSTPSTISYTLASADTAYALVVGGGGCGGTGGGGGGGAGEVVMQPVSLASGSGTVTVSVGAGAISQRSYFQVVQPQGGSSKVTGGFTITAIGGGNGGTQTGTSPTTSAVAAAGSGGSGGGGYYNTPVTAGTGVANSPTYHFGNSGAAGVAGSAAGGGGGAGGAGTASAGGPGIITSSTLYGIKDYASFGSYYWGGGGGQWNATPGVGGIGGGGGGSFNTSGALGGGSAINSGSTGVPGAVNTQCGGNGGENTGGGGGSNGTSGYSGSGGSGIVVLAIPMQTLTLTFVTITATTFVLTTSTITGANSFAVFVNNISVYTSGSGVTTLSSVTITPGSSGLVNVIVNAYDSNNNVLATASAINLFIPTILPIFQLDFTAPIAPTTSMIGSSSYPITLRGTPAIAKDASAGYVLTGTSASGFYSIPALIINSPWTMTFWFKTTATDTAANVDPLSTNAGAGGIWVNVANVPSAASPYRIVFSYGGGTNGPLILSAIYTNKWHFISIVFTGTVSRIYVDGTASTDFSTTTQLSSAINLGTYSSDNTNGGYGAGSYIYNFQMYNSALSGTQINSLMTQSKRIGT